MAIELPPPLTPAGCDLRGYDFMPTFGHRLYSSTFYGLALRNPRAGLAAMKLWWESWVQEPAASLPADDFDLARLADFGGDIKAWLEVKETALHGFIKCNDGRIYHRFLATQAIDAYDRRLKASTKRDVDKARLQAWRDAQKTRSSSEVGTGETLDETRFEAPSETPNETRFVGGRQGQGQGQGQKDSLADFASTKPASKGMSPKAKRAPKDWADDSIFAAFREAYPKADKSPASTYAAWLKALKSTSAAEIMDGLAVHPFNSDEKYRLDPAKWLNGQSWHTVTKPAQMPLVAPRPVKTAAGHVLSDDDLWGVTT
jgi:hypothetical protein